MVAGCYVRDRYAGNLKVAMPLRRYRGWEQDRSLRVMVRGDALMAEEVEKVVLEPAFALEVVVETLGILVAGDLGVELELGVVDGGGENFDLLRLCRHAIEDQILEIPGLVGSDEPQVQLELARWLVVDLVVGMGSAY
jgi:hypothetical protein